MRSTVYIPTYRANPLLVKAAQLKKYDKSDNYITVSSYGFVLNVFISMLSFDLFLNCKFHRAIGLSRPLHWPRVCTKRKVKVALVLVLAWAIVLNFPLMLQYRWVDAPPNVTGTVFTVGSDYSTTFFHQEVCAVLCSTVYQ